MAKRKRRAFTKEFKPEAVRVDRVDGGAGAGSHGDGPSGVGAANRDRCGPGQPGALTTDERAELAQL